MYRVNYGNGRASDPLPTLKDARRLYLRTVAPSYAWIEREDDQGHWTRMSLLEQMHALTD